MDNASRLEEDAVRVADGVQEIVHGVEDLLSGHMPGDRLEICGRRSDHPVLGDETLRRLRQPLMFSGEASPYNPRSHRFTGDSNRSADPAPASS